MENCLFKELKGSVDNKHLPMLDGLYCNFEEVLTNFSMEIAVLNSSNPVQVIKSDGTQTSVTSTSSTGINVSGDVYNIVPRNRLKIIKLYQSVFMPDMSYCKNTQQLTLDNISDFEVSKLPSENNSLKDINLRNLNVTNNELNNWLASCTNLEKLVLYHTISQIDIINILLNNVGLWSIQAEGLNVDVVDVAKTVRKTSSSLHEIKFLYTHLYNGTTLITSSTCYVQWTATKITVLNSSRTVIAEIDNSDVLD